MPRVTFVQPDGSRQTLDAAEGMTGMDVARHHGVRGLRGECGGEALCSTCHCYVDAEWAARVPPRDKKEADLLDFVWDRHERSRLSCQLVLTEALDGLVLHVPERQL
ncbi:MAG TPA: 2Fe-2S iron-sulfur cluster-binding protein [Usitatibacter sp.]|nr:2Fe-2S iron-sulfur cluster-binding protein [Usitatibacter sp.]